VARRQRSCSFRSPYHPGRARTTERLGMSGAKPHRCGGFAGSGQAGRRKSAADTEAEAKSPKKAGCEKPTRYFEVPGMIPTTERRTASVGLKRRASLDWCAARQ